MNNQQFLAFLCGLTIASAWVGKKIGNRLAKKYPLHKGMYD